MSILEKIKGNLKAECPNCEKWVLAEKVVIHNAWEATAYYKCGCGWKSKEELTLSVRVDTIE